MENTTSYEVFDYIFEKVMEYCESLKNGNEQILYLKYVIKEYMNNKSSFEIGLDLYELPFDKRIQNEIKFLNEKNKLSNQNYSKKNAKIVWQKNKQDFAALFSLLMELGFISYKKDKLKMLSEHFTWIDGEMKPEQLRQALNNIKNKSETHQLSDEMQNIIDQLKKK